MSFKAYIAGRRVTDTPAGDFVADAKKDGALPDASCWTELEQYLINARAHHDAIPAARLVWLGYVAKRRREAARA